MIGTGPVDSSTLSGKASAQSVAASLPPSPEDLVLFVGDITQRTKSTATLNEFKEALIQKLALKWDGHPLSIEALGLALRATNHVLVGGGALLTSLGIGNGTKLDWYR